MQFIRQFSKKPLGIAMSIGLLSLSIAAQAEIEYPDFDGATTVLNLPMLSINKQVWYSDVQIELNLGTGKFALLGASEASAPQSEQPQACVSDGSVGINYYVNPSMQAIEGGVEIINTWKSSGGRNRSSFKNHHFVFDVTQSGNVAFKIESEVTNYMYLINSLGFIVNETSSNTFTEDLSAGTYTLIAAAYSVNQSTNYSLKLQGSIDNIKKIQSTTSEIVGTWDSSGGQLKKSYRNKHYLFNVASDSYIDVDITSNVANYFYLINSLGFVVAKGSGNHFASEVPAGSYELVVATYRRGMSSNYQFNMTGQFSDLTEKTSNTVETIGSWVSSGGQDRNSVNNPSYSFDVTEDSLVDVTVVSSVSNYLYLVDSLDIVVKKVSGNELTALVPAGRYKLVAATYHNEQSSNFVLNVNGQIDDFVEN